MTDLTRLYLVRHGNVAAEWSDRLYGGLDVPLGPDGERQSRRIASVLDGLHLDAVVSSGMERAEHTAELLRGPRGLPRRDDPRLAEIDRGRWAGMDEAQVEAERPGGWSAFWRAGGVEPPPQGESLGDLAARVLPALQDLADEHCGGALAVVAHKWVLRVAVGSCLGLPWPELKRLEVPTSAMVVLDWPSGAQRRAGRLPVLVAFGVDRLP